MSNRSFNWQGINENNDGTFTTQGKREKRRLLKEFHKQGVSVRSKKNSDGSYTLTPIGRISRKSARIPARSSRPVYATGGYRPISKTKTYPRFPHARPGAAGRSRQFGPTPRAGPGPIFGGSGSGPRAKGESFYQKIIRKHKENREAEVQRKKDAKETEEKLKQDRIAQERKETAEQVSRQAEKRKLLFDRQQFERTQRADRMRNQSSFGSTGWERPKQSDYAERHEGMVTASNVSPKSDHGPLFQPAPQQAPQQKEQKLDQVKLQVARQNQITSGEN